jgi:hypothetical protein
LLVLAFVSSFAASPDPLDLPLPVPANLFVTLWNQAEHDYAAQVFSLVSARLESFRRNGGYGNIGVYVRELSSGFELGYDAEHTALDQEGDYSGYYHTASVAKLLISYVFYHLDDLGEVDIHERYFDAATGQTYDLQPMIRRMITNSVNLYHNVLLRYLGREKACATLQALGLAASRLSRELAWAPGTSDAACLERYGTLEPPRTTPKDMGMLLSALASGKVLSEKNNRLLLDALTHTIYNTRIPAGLGYQAPVAHKTGSKDYVYNDAALVLLADNPYVLVILTRGVPASVQSTMRQISGDLFTFSRQRQESGEITRVSTLLRLAQAGGR